MLRKTVAWLFLLALVIPGLAFAGEDQKVFQIKPVEVLRQDKVDTWLGQNPNYDQ